MRGIVAHRPTSQEKSGALSDHPTSDKAAWGHSPDVPVWRDGDNTTERGGSCRPSTHPDADRKKPSSGRIVETMRTQSPPNSIMAVFSVLFRSKMEVYCT